MTDTVVSLIVVMGLINLVANGCFSLIIVSAIEKAQKEGE